MIRGYFSTIVVLSLVLCASSASGATNPGDRPLAGAKQDPAGGRAPFPAVEAEAGFSYEALSRGFSDWKSVYLDFSKRLSVRKTLYGSVRWTERFDLDDEEAAAGAYLPAGEKWGMHFEGSLSPSHQVLPAYSLLGEVERIFEKGYVAHAGVRLTEYTDASTLLGILTLERYVGNFRAAYTFYESYLLWDTLSSSHRLQANYYYGDKSSVGISGTIGREAERVAPDRVLITDVAAIAVPGLHWLNPEWAVSYEAGVQRQGDNYTKSGVRVGIRHLF